MQKVHLSIMLLPCLFDMVGIPFRGGMTCLRQIERGAMGGECAFWTVYLSISAFGLRSRPRNLVYELDCCHEKKF